MCVHAHVCMGGKCVCVRVHAHVCACGRRVCVCAHVHAHMCVYGRQVWCVCVCVCMGGKLGGSQLPGSVLEVLSVSVCVGDPRVRLCVCVFV